MNLKKLKDNINEEVLKLLNQILTDNTLTIKDKKNAFETIWYFVIERNNYLYSDNSEIATQFSKLYLTEEIKNKSCFTKLLTNISEEIQRVENPQCDNKITKPDEKKLREQKETLLNKIMATITLALNIKDYNEEDFYELTTKVLRSNLERGNYRFICESVKNEAIKNNPDKLKIIIDVVLKNKVNINIGNGWSLYPHVFNVLTDSDLLELDDNYYRKVVEMAIYYLEPYVLDIALQHKNLTPNKKMAIIDYYHIMMRKYLKEYWLVGEHTAKNHADETIFSVVYCDRLLSMDDETYTKTLKEIKNCNKPFSFAEIQSNEKLTNEQRNFICELINSGEARKQENDQNEKPYDDYKIELAKTAISPILLKFPIEEYKKILILLDNYCETTENLYYEEKNRRNWHNNHRNLRHIVELLNATETFKNNTQRLLIAIDEILSNRSEIFSNCGLYISENLINFLTNKISMYYTDEEYKRAIKLLKYADQGRHAYEVQKLFTNSNVPFMEDKTPLFQMAESTSREDIESYTEELNKLGKYSMNVHLIFDDVDEEIIQAITNNQPLRVKKIVRKI